MTEGGEERRPNKGLHNLYTLSHPKVILSSLYCEEWMVLHLSVLNWIKEQFSWDNIPKLSFLPYHMFPIICSF
jgi:hypothetical protein